MPLLIDTHAFLWFVFDDPRLSPRAHELLSDPKETKVVSIVSLWEIAVKVSISKLKLGLTYEAFLDCCITQSEIELQPIELAHLIEYTKLPMHHKDPFDRLLIAQCRAEGWPIVTIDSRFGDYDIEVLW